jgi:hypothetical protein
MTDSRQREANLMDAIGRQLADDLRVAVTQVASEQGLDDLVRPPAAWPEGDWLPAWTLDALGPTGSVRALRLMEQTRHERHQAELRAARCNSWRPFLQGAATIFDLFPPRPARRR